MSKHFLALNIPDTYNTRIITIEDESVYSSTVGVSCERLEIWPPGYNTPFIVEVTHNFRLNLSACLIGIQRYDCETIQENLPDGIYIIKYSVSPNEKVFVEYNYLRIAGVMNAYNQALGKTLLQPCNPDEETESKLEELRLIKSYIDVAKVVVEIRHKPEEGMNLLNYAIKRLEKMGSKHCCK